MTSKILSIIVPSYNMERYLQTCLGRLVLTPELMERLEVLVVNDGSKDRTSEIAHEFAEKYPNTFHVIDKKNGHYGSCVNEGLKVASGEYVKILDADDYFEQEAFKGLLDLMIKQVDSSEPADMVISDYCKVDPDGREYEFTNFALPRGSSFDLKEIPLSTPSIYIQAIAYRTQMLRGFDYVQSEGIPYTDSEWSIEPLHAVRRAVYFHKPVSRYLIGRAGQTMEDAVFAKGFPVVEKIAEGMLGRFSERIKGAASDGARDYYQRAIVAQLGMIYFACIIGWHGYWVSAKLQSLDDMLRSVSLELWNEIGELKYPSRKFPIPYVWFWRKCGFAARCIMFLLDHVERKAIAFRRSVMHD